MISRFSKEYLTTMGSFVRCGQAFRLGFAFALALLTCSFRSRDAANSVVGSEFETCRSYAQSVAELNAACVAHEMTRTELLERRDKCLDRIDSTAADFAKVASLTQLKSYMLLENSVLQSQAYSAMGNNTSTQNRASYQDRRNPPPSMTVMTNTDLQAVAATIEGDFLEHQLKELDAASRIVMERRFRAFRDLVAVGQEFETWQVKTAKLAEQYWTVGDVAGVRSRIEHRAGLRELGNADPNNAAANLAKAMLQTHLGEYAHALTSLVPLQDLPQWSALAVAVKAQIEARQGNSKLAQQYLKEAMLHGKQDRRVRLIRAQTLAIAGDFEASRDEWELILKHGKDEIAAHRALALIYVSMTSRTPKSIDRALEHAQLASKLAGEQQWSCQIALALAQAARGNTDEAIALAERAQELAVDEQKRLCFDIAQQIEAGQHVVWKFD